MVADRSLPDAVYEGQAPITNREHREAMAAAAVASGAPVAAPLFIARGFGSRGYRAPKGLDEENMPTLVVGCSCKILSCKTVSVADQQLCRDTRLARYKEHNKAGGDSFMRESIQDSPRTVARAALCQRKHGSNGRRAVGGAPCAWDGAAAGDGVHVLRVLEAVRPGEDTQSPL